MRLIERLTAGARGASNPAFEELPLFIGVGPTKTGTSTVYHYLSAHPEFHASPVKELQFFSALFDERNPQRHDRRVARLITELAGDPELVTAPAKKLRLATLAERLRMTDEPDRYIGLFRQTIGAGQRAFGELTPTYCGLSEECFAFIRQQHPQVKLLITLRDPLDRLDAVLRHDWKVGRKTPHAEFFGETLPLRLRRMNFHYDEVLARVFSAFGESEVLIQFFEDMFTQRAFDELTDFIGIGRRPGDIDTRFGHSPRGEDISEAHRARAARYLEPVYSYCRDRFGDALPTSWADV